MAGRFLYCFSKVTTLNWAAQKNYLPQNQAWFFKNRCFTHVLPSLKASLLIDLPFCHISNKKLSINYLAETFKKSLYPVKIDSFSRSTTVGHFQWPFSDCMVGKDLKILFDVENCSERTSFSRNCKRRKQKLMSKWLWSMSTEKLQTSSTDTKCLNSQPRYWERNLFNVNQYLH